MRLKELRGLPVIDPTAARKIGTVLDYQVDPASGRLAALDITSIADGDGERVLAARIRRVGRSAVILTGRGGNVAGTTPEVDERWLDASTLGGLEVMGDDGNRVGRLVDATFDQDSLEIDVYLLRSSTLQRLLGRRRRISPVKGPIVQPRADAGFFGPLEGRAGTGSGRAEPARPAHAAQSRRPRGRAQFRPGT